MIEAAGTPAPGKRKWYKTLLLYLARLVLIVVPAALTAWLTLRFSASDHAIAEAGLLQPVIAAFIAFAIVLTARLTLGRFSNDSRKGTVSASSATIAVRLWALCFALLFGAILMSSAVSKWDGSLAAQNGAAPKHLETELEVSANKSAPAVATAKVTQ
jgi:hypothetical protein